MNETASQVVDLHTHTIFSDGCLSPEELVEEAVWKGLSAIAVTDHDNVDGLVRCEAAGKVRGIEVIPGVELSCEADGVEAHIVGLFLAPTEAMIAVLGRIREKRASRMREMLDRLATLGIRIAMEELPQCGDKSFGRPHLARTLVERGIVASVNEAFARYIGDDGPAYVAKTRLSVEDGIGLIRASRGLAILAHPGIGDLIERIDDFAAMGIDGVEAWYPNRTPDQEQRIRDAAARRGLVLSGGSDYHGGGQGADLGSLRVPYAILTALRRRKDERWPSGS